MHEEFVKYGTPAIKLIEECSEVIKAVCKGERFGYDDRNPNIPNSLTNREYIREEIHDMHLAVHVFEKWLETLPYDMKRIINDTPELSEDTIVLILSVQLKNTLLLSGNTERQTINLQKKLHYIRCNNNIITFELNDNEWHRLGNIDNSKFTFCSDIAEKNIVHLEHPHYPNFRIRIVKRVTI